MPLTPEFFRLSQMLQPMLEAMQSPVDEPEQMDTTSRMNQVYTPEHIASDRLNELISNFPERNKPSLGRKIIAGIAGLGSGEHDVEDVLYAPYRRELADWKEKLNPATQAANFERAGNISERQLANQIALQESRDRTFERQANRDRVLAEQSNERIRQGDERIAATAAQRAAANEIAALRAKGGVPQYDETTGKGFMVFRDGTSVPIDVSKLPIEDRMQLQQDMILERIKASAQEQRTTREQFPTASSRDRLRTEVIDDPNNPGKKILVTINLDTNEVTPATIRRGTERNTITPTTRTGKTPESEANKINRINRRALELKNSKPEWARFINIKNGKFTGITQPGLLNRMTPELYREIAKSLGLDNTETAATSSQQNSTKAIPDANELIEVINPDGERTRIRKSDLQRALAQRYRIP